MPSTETINHVVREYNDPFTTESSTKLIYFPSRSLDKAAMLSRYSRSTSSITDLITNEFDDPNRGPTFITKLLSMYGDDSIAEMASETIGIEGLSILAAAKLTDQRVGASFIEKSTRYVPYSCNSFYVPERIYELGLLDEYQDLCGQSFNTFTKIFGSLTGILRDKHPVNVFSFHDSVRNIETSYDNLTKEQDIHNADVAYNQAVKAKCFDIAGYSWLTSLKTNIGVNINARALEYLLVKTKQSPLAELKNLSTELYTLLEPYIKPLISRSKLVPAWPINNLSIYDNDNPSLTSLVKYDIMNLNHSFDYFSGGVDDSMDKDEEEFEDEELEEFEGRSKLDTMIINNAPRALNRTKINDNLINKLLYEYDPQLSYKDPHLNIDVSRLEPAVKLVDFLDEQSAIDILCAAILHENNENLLDYDKQNNNNIQDSLRILPPDLENIKQGIIYDLVNKHKHLNQIHSYDGRVYTKSENNLSFADIRDYWAENREVRNTHSYQDYRSKNTSTLPRDQEYLISRYIGNRKSRRDRLGRAFEFIDYQISVSCSYRIARELKRHRTTTMIFEPLLTARNSYESFIFPTIINQYPELFDSYKTLIDKSFVLYDKIASKSRQDYYTAQYCLPLSTKTNVMMSMNLRELDHILSLRSTPQAHPEFRDICHKLFKLLLIAHPNLAKKLKFVDLQNYELGRLKSEYKTARKINKLENS